LEKFVDTLRLRPATYGLSVSSDVFRCLRNEGNLNLFVPIDVRSSCKILLLLQEANSKNFGTLYRIANIIGMGTRRDLNGIS
jgi:hypothetical protein